MEKHVQSSVDLDSGHLASSHLNAISKIAHLGSASTQQEGAGSGLASGLVSGVSLGWVLYFSCPIPSIEFITP